MRRAARFMMFAVWVWMAITGANSVAAHGYQVEYSFQNGSDGAFPASTLLSFSGKLYGTTPYGGANGFGTVYSFNPSTGTETVLYSFKSGNDGAYPAGSLIAFNGKLYGTTANGGGSLNCNSFAAGCGTVFSIDPTTGSESVVYAFSGNDGAYPGGALIEINGKFYGIGGNGGASSACTASVGCGTIYSIDPSTGAEAVVYAFKGGADGYLPTGDLINVGGTLYGATNEGGGFCNPYGCGTIFSVNATTGAEAVVYAFKGGNDGSGPFKGPINVNGTLYGTTSGGGSICFVQHQSMTCGTVFSLDPTTSAHTVLYSFQGYRDGMHPDGKLVNVGGILYGTTSGGIGSEGTAFSINPTTKTETVLHAFKGGADGRAAESGLLYSGHRLYGTTGGGGGSLNCYAGCGTIFAVSP